MECFTFSLDCRNRDGLCRSGSHHVDSRGALRRSLSRNRRDWCTHSCRNLQLVLASAVYIGQPAYRCDCVSDNGWACPLSDKNRRSRGPDPQGHSLPRCACNNSEPGSSNPLGTVFQRSASVYPWLAITHMTVSLRPGT